jgi:flavin reductase (DIM6/NTAB) family NADH-FMN oxidoreductase RutF/DNA-binding IclR family transcriptional regulator
VTTREHEPAVTSIDLSHFRKVLGQYPTGVVVVTAFSPTGEVLGMTVGSFTSVSLDPPLVAFLPSKASRSWTALRASGGRYCVNILGSDQEDVCRNVAMRKEDKFHDIEWQVTEHGNPRICGAVAHIDCEVEAIHDSGDHDIVVARVADLAIHNSSYPLLFFRGGYGSFQPLSLVAQDVDLVGQIKLVDLVRPHIDELASRFDTEVGVSALVGQELVLVATSGRVPGAVTPTRVGQRLPFRPPLGSVFAAWGSDELREMWLGHAASSLSAEERGEHARTPDRVRERGYALALGHAEVAEVERNWTLLNEGDPTIRREQLLDDLTSVSRRFNPAHVAHDGEHDVRTVAGPVFHPNGTVAFALSLWGPPRLMSALELDEYVDALKATCAAASESLAEHHRGRPWQDGSSDSASESAR